MHIMTSIFRDQLTLLTITQLYKLSFPSSMMPEIAFNAIQL